MITEEELKERVRRGAIYLDEVRPGWRDSIAPGELRMESCFTCVLGQVFGHYAEGLSVMWDSLPEVRGMDVQAPFGLARADYDTVRDRVAAFNLLTELWAGYLKGEWD